MAYQHQRVTSIKSRVPKHAMKALFCAFCKNLGKSKSECAHSIKTCIVLKNTECRYCHELGHTKSRCPKLEAKNRANRQRSLKRPRVTPMTIGCGSGWNVVSKRMNSLDTTHRLMKKQRIVNRQVIRSNKFAALEEEDDRDFGGPKVVTATNELKGAWAKTLSSSKPVAKPVAKPVVVEKKEDMLKDMVKLEIPQYIGAWADAVSDSEDEEEDEEEIVLDSFGRPSTDNSAW